jgi:hypothetical protein
MESASTTIIGAGKEVGKLVKTPCAVPVLAKKDQFGYDRSRAVQKDRIMAWRQSEKEPRNQNTRGSLEHRVWHSIIDSRFRALDFMPAGGWKTFEPAEAFSYV